MTSPLRAALHDVRSAAVVTSPRPAWVAGLRAGFATIVPLAGGYLLGVPTVNWMSLAGFNGSLNDRGGPYRTRAATMAAVTGGAAAAAALATLAHGHVAIALPLTLALGVLCSLARVWGNAGAGAGSAVLCTFLIALSAPVRGPGDAGTRAALIVAGGLWAMLLSLVLWPLQPYRPVRRAVAACFRALADYVDDLAVRTAAGPHDPWDLRVQSVAVRTAIENGRAVIAGTRRGRPGESGRGERLLVLHEVADQVFAHLVALNDTLAAIPDAPRDQEFALRLAATLTAAAASLRGLAAAVEAESNPPPVPLGWNGSALLPSAARGSATSEDAVALHRSQAAALVDRIAEYAALGVATARGLESGRDAPEVDGIENVPPPLSALAQLRAILTPDSLVLRYALRVGLATTIAVALAAALGLRRDYWVTITVVIILQPYTGATSQKALQRLLGTVVGGILAALLGAWFHQPAAILALAFVFVTCCVALLPVNYAVFSVFVTPAFVLLAEASAGDWHLAEVRIVNTAIGGTLALLAARLFWPTPESSRLASYMAAALAANRDYLRVAATLARDSGPVNPAPLREARRAIGLAAANGEESFQRLLGEHRGPAEDLEPLMTFLTFTRRFAASVAALALAPVPPDAAALQAIQSFAEAAIRAFDDLIAAVAAARPPEPLPAAALEPVRGELPPLLRARLDRLARQLKSLHDAVAHWAERPAATAVAGSPS
jgi:uncharacterized membrane protein YccC